MRNKPPSAATIRLRGFSLLEVILALAILAGAIAVLGEVIHLARERANDCRTQTRAQLLAATLMDEIAAGLHEMTEQDREPLETDDPAAWVYSISLPEVDTDLEDLVAVEVVVEQDLDTPFRPAKTRLLRWFHTPDRPEETAGSEASPSPSGGTSD